MTNDTKFREVKPVGNSLTLNLTKIFNQIGVVEGDNIRIDILNDNSLKLAKV